MLNEVGDKEMDVDKGIVNVKENDDAIMNERSEPLSNLQSNENMNIGGGTNNAKRILPKNSNSSLKLKASWVKIDPSLPQTSKRRRRIQSFKHFSLF